MNTIIIEPKDQEEFDFFQNLIKKLKVKSKVVKETRYNAETEKSIQEVKNGKTTATTLTGLRKMMYQ